MRGKEQPKLEKCTSRTARYQYVHSTCGDLINMIDLIVRQRQDVAQTLALLLDRDDAAGLALDVIGGPTPISQALSAAIEKKDTAFWG